MSDYTNPRFEKNLKALYQKNPLLAAQLKILEPNQKYEVYVGKDPLNINIYDKERKVALFHQEPLVEVTQKIKEFEAYNLYPFFIFLVWAMESFINFYSIIPHSKNFLFLSQN